MDNNRMLPVRCQRCGAVTQLEIPAEDEHLSIEDILGGSTHADGYCNDCFEVADPLLGLRVNGQVLGLPIAWPGSGDFAFTMARNRPIEGAYGKSLDPELNAIVSTFAMGWREYATENIAINTN